MASASVRAESASDRVTSVLVTDFCPWANRYVYWLKEPIGWFVMALATSVLVGLHVSTVGWVLASVISSVIVTGMIWPWVVVRAAACRLRPAVDEIHEGQACDLILSVRNRWPLPLWGLVVEGYLDRCGDDLRPTIALACVPMFSDAEYRLRVSPTLRGQYPIVAPTIACSMPFGIWTAHQPLRGCSPLTVFPSISRIDDEPELRGGRLSETGDGARVGQVGEPLGVREFRSGDRLRNVHWIHTARTGKLTVCERHGPQQQQIDIVLDAEVLTADLPGRLLLREALARRVRVAASLAMALHSRHVPIRLVIGDMVIPIASGARGRRRVLTALAEVPADGFPLESRVMPLQQTAQRMTLRVSGDAATDNGVTDNGATDNGAVRVFIDRPMTGNDRRKHKRAACSVWISPDLPLDVQLARFWREVSDDAFAA